MMNLLEVKQFYFSYPNQSTPILKDVNFSIETGSFNVLFGKSGSGKTTLLQHLKPQLAPVGQTQGEILFLGKSVKELSLRTQSQDIGYVLQNPDNQLVTDKVWHELAFGLENLGYDTETIRLRVAEMASYFGIHNWFDKNVAELSGGQKQILNLASVMVLNPKLLILDEPTSQLDPIAAKDFLETIYKINQDIGTTIVMTEHRLQEVFPIADQVLLLEKNKPLIHGTPKEVGQILRETKGDMFLAMPIPMQIAASVEKQGTDLPLTVRTGRAWLDSLDLKEKLIEEISPVTSDSKKIVLEAKDVWFRYEQMSQDVIKDLSLKIYQGEFFGLVGGNGTGKSTALSLLGGIRQPYRGKIKVAGQSIQKYDGQALYQNLLGVLPQNPQNLFIKDTVLEDLYEVVGGMEDKDLPYYAISMTKKQMVEGISNLTHLTHLWQQHPYDLSGGEQQRLALAKILLLRPTILLLDEPTKGLDDFYKEELGQILQQLNEQGITIVMVSHDIEFVANYAHRCGLFFNGNLVSIQPTREFFAGNQFYTTTANRMARQYFPNGITLKDVVGCINHQKSF